MGTGGIVYGKFRKFNVEISVFGQAEDDPFSSCSIMHNRLKLCGNYAVISCRLPLLKYNSAVWSPYLKSDIQAIEHVQRRCMVWYGMVYVDLYSAIVANVSNASVHGFGVYSYEEWLRLLQLRSLELRRLRIDLVHGATK